MIKKVWVAATCLATVFSMAAAQQTALPELQKRGGLPSFFTALQTKDTVVIAYLGGSITSAPGYRVQTEAWFRQQYPQTVFKTVNAGLGGTGSDLGVFRLQENVLAHKPDLVFVEFAVNDYGTDTAITAAAMEGIVRQVKKANPATSVCLLYTISRPMLQELGEGRLVRSMRVMERLADHYALPSINLTTEVLSLLKANQLVFETKDSTDSQGRIIFSNDGVHPTAAGHQVYTKVVGRSFTSMATMVVRNKRHRLPKPLYVNNYSQVAYLSPTVFSKTQGWQAIEKEHRTLGRFATSLPGIMRTDNPADSLVIHFNGTVIGFEDIISPSSCGALISIDGGNPVAIKRFDIYANGTRRHYYLLDALPNGPHTIVIKMDTTPLDKLAIVKKHEIKDPEAFKENYLYIGRVLLVGKVLPNANAF
jgi:lysophospholipase L1-like esterase